MKAADNDRPAARSGPVKVGRSRTSRASPRRPRSSTSSRGCWEEFKQSEVSGAREGARERLILHYAPLVKYVASRVATGLPASVDQADLVCYGMFGLIDALEKFEPGPRQQVRDLRDPADQGRDHRRAPGDGLGAPIVRFKAREIEKAYSDLESMLQAGSRPRRSWPSGSGISLRELHEVVIADLVRLGARSSTRWSSASAATAASRCR